MKIYKFELTNLNSYGDKGYFLTREEAIQALTKRVRERRIKELGGVWVKGLEDLSNQTGDIIIEYRYPNTCPYIYSETLSHYGNVYEIEVGRVTPLGEEL